MTKVENTKLLGWTRNPHHDNSIKIIRYRSDVSSDDIRACLKIHNSDKPIDFKLNEDKLLGAYFRSVKGGEENLFVSDCLNIPSPDWEVVYPDRELVKRLKRNAIPEGCRAYATTPKWTGHFKGDKIDEETGEITEEVWSCTDDDMALSRKRKAIKKFSEAYSTLYEQRKISCLFLTLTQCNKSSMTIAEFIDVMQKRFLRHKLPVLGYFWVHEISEGHHHHYHIAIAIKRVFWKKLPRWVKFDDVWDRGTSIEFIRKSIKAYLGKYIGKSNIGRLMNYRKYGKSRQYKTP